MRSWGGAFVRVLAGAVALGLVQGLLRLPFDAEVFGAEVLGACVAGALLAGLLVWPPVVLLAKLRQPAQAPRNGTAFWIGWGVGLGPLTHNFLFLDGGPLLPRLAVITIVPALLFLAAPRLGERLDPPRRLVQALLLAAAFAYPAGLLLFPGHPDLGPRGLPPAAIPDPADPAAVAADAALHLGPDRPDVYLISVDTLRADAILDPAAATPTLDRLRAEGAWAPYALSSSNQTLPGHVGMLTGTGAAAHGVRSNIGLLPPELPLLSESFRDRGYRTAGFVSNGLLRAAAGFGRGWELYDDTAVAHAGSARLFLDRIDRHTVLGWLLPQPLLRVLIGGTVLRDFAALERDSATRGSGARITERALLGLEQLFASPRPAFVFVHYMDPHTPYGAPAPFRGRHTDGLELPARYALDRFGRAGIDLTAAIERDLASAAPADREAAAAGAAYLAALYREEVEFVDHNLGRLLARIEAGGRPSVLLFTSDHGEHFGEHGLMEHANSLYDPLLRVPFVLWGSGVAPRELPPAHLADVPALLLSLGRAAPATAPLHLARDESRLAIRDGALKWRARLRPGADAASHAGLHDLAADPGERADLGEAALTAPLRTGAADFAAQERVRAAEQAELDAEQLSLLRMMGYLDGGEEDEEE